MHRAEVCVTLFDTTGRDGAQSMPRTNEFPIGSKVEIADTMARLGLGVIEAGFPATLPVNGHVGPTETEEVTEVADVVGSGQGYEVIEWMDHKMVASRERTPIIAGLCRVLPDEIDTTWSAIQAADHPRIHTFVSTEDNHREAKFGVDREQLIEMIKKGVSYARSISTGHPGATIEWSAEAASDTDEVYLERSIKTAVDAGANVVNLPNTVGGILPDEAQDRFRKYISWIMGINQDVTVSVHEHNDLGFAVANTSLFVAEAVEWVKTSGRSINIQLETTACGLGERAGNADIFPVVAGLAARSERSDVPIRWQFNPWLAVESGQKIMSVAELTVDRQNPVIGRDVMRHRSGIHSDGVLKGGPLLYAGVRATEYGHSDDAVHEDGRYQGKRGREAAHVANSTLL